MLPQKAMNLTPTVPFLPPVGDQSKNRSCSVLLSVITFLALKDITAVSWLTAGLAEWHGALSARALGLVAGTEVTSALGQYGGAATSRGRVTLGED